MYQRPCFAHLCLLIHNALLLLLFLCLICINNSFANPVTTSTSSNYLVKISGITGAPLKNIQHALSVFRYKSYISKQAKLRLPLYFQQGKQEIIDSLQPYGYFNSQVTAAIHWNMKPILITYMINPGPQTTVSKITLNISGEGKNLHQFKHWQKRFPLQVGRPMISIDYENAKARLLAWANELGFFNALLTSHQVTINSKTHQATITLAMNTGPRAYFSSVSFNQGNQNNSAPYANSYLKRFIPFKANTPYQESTLVQLQSNLIASNLFDEVIVSREKTQTSTPPKVPLTVTLIPKKAKHYKFGLGYGTDTGIRGTFGFDWRRVTASGQNLSSQIQLSQIATHYSLAYIIPGQNPLTDATTLSAADYYDHPDSYTSTTQQIGLGYTSTYGTWTYQANLKHQWVQYNINNGLNQNTNLTIPELSLSRIVPTQQGFWHNGYQITANLQAGIPALSPINFTRLTLNARLAHKLTRKTRMLLGGAFGLIETNDFDELPPNLRFFAGGSNSIRGYGYKSLSTTSPDGQQIGGRYLLTGTLAYEIQLPHQFGLSAFYDLGNAFYNKPKSLELMQGAGLQLAWYSPIGPVKLAVAKALSLSGTPWHIHFSIGFFI
ncbi:Autotransporter assembly factor TamA [Piscirickettsia salmonis]|uniref:Translocation and assembly module subunit TamA n=1 Tax=Piscirickettsia salmonis TaxID=1238 RepID=A0A1L6TC48_PISSA|nr:BamA/TamA family outer membrane protein [Piscirickettsia salmonis]AKP74077.2 hypothetical protein PSLF89_2390 [Piscirickettsia salmonis LF-89 = ATCC VR-1361]ALB22947.1 surface antigen family protein [Piscirickettsia salmonis]AMA42453.1 hypothetical protein AWJ11_08850 [Piscirickettsia salmonis]AOS34923.1 hypothetical protein AVM72_05990 [Piscirickettsia salmonis]APS59631.1 hypothetical protein AVI53_02905 [Piscirickettsia salmonis]